MMKRSVSSHDCKSRSTQRFLRTFESIIIHGYHYSHERINLVDAVCITSLFTEICRREGRRRSDQHIVNDWRRWKRPSFSRILTNAQNMRALDPDLAVEAREDGCICYMTRRERNKILNSIIYPILSFRILDQVGYPSAKKTTT